jgi:hypothetical protein
MQDVKLFVKNIIYKKNINKKKFLITSTKERSDEKAIKPTAQIKY